jgi:hypothetical protein
MLIRVGWFSGVYGMEEYWHGVTRGNGLTWVDGVHMGLFSVLLLRCIPQVAAASL